MDVQERKLIPDSRFLTPDDKKNFLCYQEAGTGNQKSGVCRTLTAKTL
jgi:hypothetical protein